MEEGCGENNGVARICLSIQRAAKFKPDLAISEHDGDFLLAVHA